MGARKTSETYRSVMDLLKEGGISPAKLKNTIDAIKKVPNTDSSLWKYLEGLRHLLKVMEDLSDFKNELNCELGVRRLLALVYTLNLSLSSIFHSRICRNATCISSVSPRVKFDTLLSSWIP